VEGREGLCLCLYTQSRREGGREGRKGKSKSHTYLKGKVRRVVVGGHVVTERFEVREERLARAMVRHVAARGQEEDVGEVAPHLRGRGVDDAHDHASGPAVLADGQGVQQIGHQLTHHGVQA